MTPADYLRPTTLRTPPRKPRPIRRDFRKCPRCHSPTQKAIAMNGHESQFWLECTYCNTYINTYIPQVHQEGVHLDPHRTIGNFGAYGTGKTTTTRQEIFKHCFITPNANVLIGAAVTSQYEQTIKREIEADLPQAFIADESLKDKTVDLHNGARLLYRPYDDAGKMRSYNLTMAVGVEASEYSAEIYHQHKTRLRNTAACVFERDEAGELVLDFDDRGVGTPRVLYDWRKILVESNPDNGWIRTDLLNVASDIRQYGTVAETYATDPAVADPAISAHVASTDVNRFLPPGYIEENCRNKPKWWIARYIYSSFAYAEGQVYPAYTKTICPTFQPPPEWKRIVAFDYGLRDDAVFLFGALDETAGIVYIYKEVRTNNRNLDDLAALYFEHTADIPSGGLYCAPIADPKSIAKRDYNKDSLGDLFLQKGIAFKPGYISLDARIYRLSTYLESGKLKIMDCCTGLLCELREYKFPPQTLDGGKPSDKPIDKDNHAINPLEWIVMELPDDPSKLTYGAYNRFGQDLTRPGQTKPKVTPWQLRDDVVAATDPDRAYGMAPYTEYF